MKGLIFTYALTYGGAAVALFNPFVGLLIYVCFAILKPEALWFWSVPPGNYSRIVAIGLLLGWAINGFGRLRFGRAAPIVLAFVCYYLWMIVTTAKTPIGVPAWDFVENIGKVVLPFVVGVTLLDSLTKIKLLTWVIALSQSYVALEFNLAYFDGVNTLHEFGFAGMDNNSVAIALVTAAGLTFFLGLYARNWLLKLLAFGGAAVLAHAVMFSFSRGGVLALICTGIATFFLIPKKAQHYAFFALAVVLAFMMAGPEVRERFFTAFADKEHRDEAAQNRVDYWGYAWEIMRQEPVFGIGPRQFTDWVPRNKGGNRAEAHNLWLQTGAEMGFPGLLSLAAVYGTCIAGMWRLSRQSFAGEDPAFRYLPRMVMASLIGFGAASQFVSLYGLEIPYYVVLIGAGLLRISPADATVPTPTLESSQAEPAEFDLAAH